MKRVLPFPGAVFGLTVLSFAALVLPAQAQVAILDFDEGNGASSVDQYTGIAGSGWSSAWSSGFGTNVTSSTVSVENSAELTSGGGNYLQVTYSTDGGGSRAARVSRQWDSSAVPLTEPFQLSFDIRTDTALSTSTQNLVLFAANAATSGTGSESWRIGSSGAGWFVYDQNVGGLVDLGTGAIGADETWHFSLTIDAVSDTYIVSAYEASDPGTVFTSGVLALRNGGDANLRYLNFVSNGGGNQTDLGFAVDNISVIPEPDSAAFLMGCGGLSLLSLRHRRRQRVIATG